MDGLTVLVEAKKEYLAQLCSVMCPHMISTFEVLYSESNNISKGKKVLAQYQKLLKEVPNWNDHMIHQHAEKLSNTCGWFNDLLAAVFVSYVKILSSVRLNSENKKISVKLPSNDVFIHGCYINAAKDLYKDPFVYHDELSEYDRDSQLTRRFVLCIETTVKEMIPIQEILKAYISNKDKIEVDNRPDEDTEDPEILDHQDDFPPAPPMEEAPVDPAAPIDPAAPVDPMAPPAAEGAPAPVAVPAVPAAPGAPEAELKNISLNKVDDDVLFPDARD
jgi:hypothetical protein